MKTGRKQTFLNVKRTMGITLLSFLSLTTVSRADITVFAAASTTDVMKELAVSFKKSGGETIRFNFASSGALARQLDAGAPADIYISANVKWMDFVEGKNLTQKDSRTVIAKNSLVLIAPSDSNLTYDGFPQNLKGRLAIGEPKSVPAGAYALAALESLNQFDAVKKSLIKGKDVRTVLLYVSRKEVEAGIVYRTDAMYSDKVKVLGPFPASAHPPILYPAVCLENSAAEAGAFLDFMKSDEGKRILQKHGFSE